MLDFGLEGVARVPVVSFLIFDSILKFSFFSFSGYPKRITKKRRRRFIGLKGSTLSQFFSIRELEMTQWTVLGQKMPMDD